MPKLLLIKVQKFILRKLFKKQRLCEKIKEKYSTLIDLQKIEKSYKDKIN